MKLIIGGYGQGKNEYVNERFKEAASPAVFRDLHLFIRSRMLDGKDPEPEIFEYIKKNPDCVIISDEIGNGIVPMDPFEREYRERCGRILIRIAKDAGEVVRVVCGIGQRIK